MPSETPRTDGVYSEHSANFDRNYRGLHELARQLERELAAAKRDHSLAQHALRTDNQRLQADLAAAQAQLAEAKKYMDGVRCPQCDQLRLELGEARKDAERWRERKKALDRVDKEMPEGWHIVLNCEPEDWYISLYDPDGKYVEISDFDDETDFINRAVEEAIDRARGERT